MPSYLRFFANYCLTVFGLTGLVMGMANNLLQFAYKSFLLLIAAFAMFMFDFGGNAAFGIGEIIAALAVGVSFTFSNFEGISMRV